MDYLNLEPRTRNDYTPEMVEGWFARFGTMEAVAKYLGIQKASLSRIISRRQSLSEAREKGIKKYAFR